MCQSWSVAFREYQVSLASYSLVLFFLFHNRSKCISLLRNSERCNFSSILRWYIHTYIHTYIYIYIYREREREREKLKNKVIQREEVNVKESHRYNVLVLMNHHQELDGWFWMKLNHCWIFFLIIYKTRRKYYIYTYIYIQLLLIKSTIIIGCK